MKKWTVISFAGVGAGMFVWSVPALAQLTPVELVEARAITKAGEAESKSLKPGVSSALRQATQSSERVRQRENHKDRSAPERRSGARASAKCQSEVAEHRQERRGAAAGAGKPGGAGKAAPVQ